ncbi:MULTISPECIES: pseudouridine synthase [Alteribacter]|uniref:Pseudouridine synthase n=1 Tax=Alteribacter keqinensis TaxID=2483800 RepID=A0A3M7TXT1_9BACI|nr:MULTISPECIES: pseudouridine synthase [Alteribacter]MBM7096369.1 rRNA pseudouridine synthase [Alteribacter salitolerans]RNA70408.1 rRNA pseudouridine synthase [Alteribacter keqinensis]
MRLDKLLANMGFGSRKDVKKLFKQGSVTVNETPAKDGKTHVDPENDVIIVNGEELEYKEFIYLMMNKPQGVISATEDKSEQTVIDLLEPEDLVFEPFPVGRLDKDTVGLMFLTNDGKLAHQLTSPKKKVTKLYVATIDQALGEKEISALESGVTLDDGYETKPATVEVLAQGDGLKIRLGIMEGKFHQVKRMFEAVGRKVVFLKRETIGSLTLDETLEPGTYRELTDEELALIKGETPSEEKA